MEKERPFFLNVQQFQTYNTSTSLIIGPNNTNLNRPKKSILFHNIMVINSD